jgi:hypothetical protein
MLSYVSRRGPATIHRFGFSFESRYQCVSHIFGLFASFEFVVDWPLSSDLYDYTRSHPTTAHLLACSTERPPIRHHVSSGYGDLIPPMTPTQLLKTISFLSMLSILLPPDLFDIGMRDVVMKTSFLLFLVLYRSGSGSL